MNPIIGVSTALSAETWALSGDYNYVERLYTNAIFESGGIPIMLVPYHDKNRLNTDVKKILERMNGLLLTGGGNTKRFDSGNLPDLFDQQPIRYNYEKQLIEGAFEIDMPVLGICRGHQMMAEVLGGKLKDEIISGHRQNGQKEEPIMHDIKVLEGSKLEQYCGCSKWKVNSYHCQVVEQVPDTFIPCCWSEDGYIEAMESPDKSFFIGVQFHPELMIAYDGIAKKLLNTFIDEVGKYSHRRGYK